MGVGYNARAEAGGSLLCLKLGYSHEVELVVPPAVRVFCFKNNVFCVLLHRARQAEGAPVCCKPPDVYKGKGILYLDETFRTKYGRILQLSP